MTGEEVALLETALRVLQAISDWGNPEDRDVSDLRRLTPEYGACAIDELACEVIQRALENQPSHAGASEMARSSYFPASADSGNCAERSPMKSAAHG
jgi:hypothetical protein